MKTAPRRPAVALLLAAVASLWTLGFVATAQAPQHVAGLPWYGLPTGALQWGLPPLVALPLAWALGRAPAQEPRPAAAAWRWVAVLAVLALLTLWLATLARHDRPLTAWHCLALLAALVSCARRAPWRLALGLAASGVLALVSYGAIWGETRCQEPDSTGCLVNSGPRVWVPALLAGAAVPVFANLQGADLRGADLRQRDLRYANLRGARLEGARLDGSNLRRARLDGVDAPRSSWVGVFMNGASARRGRFWGADMRQLQAYRVDFALAELRDADLRNASLSHARLQGSVLTGTRVEGAYLRFTEPPWPGPQAPHQLRP